MRSLLTTLCLGVALVLPACGPPRKDPAIATYEQFVAAVRQGRSEAVWHLLSPDARRTLAQRLGLPSDAPAEAVLSRLAVRPGAELELDFPQQARLDPNAITTDRRVVVAPLAGRTVRLSVIRVEGGWRIDLFDEPPPGDAPG